MGQHLARSAPPKSINLSPPLNIHINKNHPPTVDLYTFTYSVPPPNVFAGGSIHRQRGARSVFAGSLVANSSSSSSSTRARRSGSHSPLWECVIYSGRERGGGRSSRGDRIDFLLARAWRLLRRLPPSLPRGALQRGWAAMLLLLLEFHSRI